MEKKKKCNWITLLCAVAVVAAAVCVRLPAASLSRLSEEQRAVCTNESGLPYMTDPDSFFYARVTDSMLDDETCNPVQAENGVLQDTQSYYPEGRTSEYQPGIVWMTNVVRSVMGLFSGADLYTAEYWLPAIMAALAALAAFFLGRRIAGTIGGLAAGILVSCAPAFTARVLPGRFDTDMFTAIMDVLLILTMTEAMRAQKRWTRLVCAGCFGLTVLAYSWCWSVYALFFAALTLGGGAVFLLVLFFAFGSERGDRPRASWFIRQKEVQAWLLCLALCVILLLAVNGPSFFGRFFHTMSWAGSMTESGTLPNLYGSITELNHPLFATSDPEEWLLAYIPGNTLTVLGGTGGLTVAILCVGGILMMLIRILPAHRSAAKSSANSDSERTADTEDETGHTAAEVSEEAETAAEEAAEAETAAEVSADVEEAAEETDRHVRVLYLCMLIVWFAGAMYASMQGIRFVEHLSVPVGMFAGCCVQWITPGIVRGSRVRFIASLAVTLVVCAAAVAIPIRAAVKICQENRPSVTDSMAEGMAWIRENAEDPEAVIASWWDFGYFYSYSSGHPVFWDGGSQSGLRALLIARAITADSRLLSERILQMLASYGDEPVKQLMAQLGEKEAFDALWDMLLMEEEATAVCLEETYGFSAEEAEALAGMLHPEQEKEVYLVLSGDMLYKLGWIEYYANWDFSGRAKQPTATVYNVMPDGSFNMDSEDEEARAFFEARAQETIWKLFFDAAGEDCFTRLFQESDGTSQIQIWRAGEEPEFSLQP